ncbi:MAG: aminopeptidase P family protein [Chloroflexi bacterium]|nr:aminopeptidase P family protein [Chloroflexota bacterium]MBP8059389.1 aminopeptidase P family protein [Chloroflexota bacterium]
MMHNKQLIQEKVKQAIGILRELDLDVWLTFVRETMLTPDPALDLIVGQGMTWQSAFIITRDGRAIALIGHYDAENIRQLGVYTEVIGYHQGIAELLRETLVKLNPHQIALNYSERDVAADGLSVGLYRLLEKYLAGTGLAERFVSAEGVMQRLRGRKSPTEVARIRQAVATTETLFDAIEQYAQPGMTQRQIADFVQAKIDALQLGYAWEKEFNPIVTCGPHSPVGHAAPGHVILEKGHTLHVDLGVKQNDYCADLQRMWYVLNDGETTAPPEVEHAFAVVYGAIKAGEARLKPGILGWQVDQEARDYITDNGYPEYMHAFGHLLGRAAHDGATVLGPQWERYTGMCDLAVEAGNVFTLEPHVVIPNRGIMSLEEDVLVTEWGVEYLSTPQTSLRYIK